MENKLNRFLSALLVLAMVISMLPLSVIATGTATVGDSGGNSEQVDELVNLDFEDYEAGAVPGTVSTDGEAATTYAQVENVNGNNVLALKRASGKRLYWYYDLDDTYDTVTLTYNVAVKSAQVDSSSIYFPTVSDSHTSMNVEFGLRGGAYVQWNSSTTTTASFQSVTSAADSTAYVRYQQLKWYTVKVVYNKTAEGATAKVYIDDVLTNVNPRKTTGITMIAIALAQAWKDSEIYVDDIRVTTGTRDAADGSTHDAVAPTGHLHDTTPVWSDGVCSTCLAHCDHDWQNASCASAKHCDNCQLTEGEALGHSYTGANGVCVNGCGNTEQKNYLLDNALAYLDFEGEDPETGNTNNTDTSTYGTAEVVKVNGNSVLKIASGPNIADSTFRWYYPVSTSGLSKVTVTYNVAAVDGNYLWFPAPSKTNYPHDVQFGVYGGAMKQQTGSTWSSLTVGEGENAEAVPYVKLRWHTVKIVYSRTDSSSCEVKLYLDGQLTNAGVVNGHGNIINIAAQIYKNSAGSMYIDNLCVTAGDIVNDAAVPTGCLCDTPVWVGGVCSVCQAHCAHNWQAASCAAAKHCDNCQLTEGEALAHSYTGEGGACVNGCGNTEEQNYILANYLAYFDFEDGAVQGTVAQGDAADVTVQDVNGNKVLVIDPTTSTSTRWVYPLGGSYSKLTVSYHVALATAAGTTQAMFPTITDGATYSLNVEFGANSNSTLKYATTAGSPSNTLTSKDGQTNIAYKQLQWYTVKIVYDYDTSSVKVYIDGVETCVGIGRAVAASQKIQNLVVKFYNSNSIMYVDNIRVTEGDHTPASVTCLGECSFDQQVVSDAYKASAASCAKSATYYYSCVCGEKGTTTFESGDPLAHSYTGEGGACVNGCGRTEAQNEILANYLAYFDFEDGEVRGAMTAANGTAAIKEVNGNKLLSLKSDGASSVRWYYPLGGSYSDVTMTYHVAVVSPYNNLRVTFPTVSDAEYHVTNAEFGIIANNKLSWSPDGSARPLVTSAADATANVAYKQLKWYTVKVVYSTDGTASTAKVYIDGVLTNVESRRATEITHLAVKFYTGSEMEIYVDNIRVTEGDHTPATVTCLGECSFDQQVVSDAYKASAASCTKSATYYYSCVCGEKGTTTFESGDPLVHSYTGANGTCVNGCGRTETQNEILATYLAYFDFEDGEVRGVMSDANGTAQVKEVNGNKLLSLKADGASSVRWYYPLGGSYSNVTMTYHVAVVSPYSNARVMFPTVSDSSYWATNVEFGVLANNNLQWHNGTAWQGSVTSADGATNVAYKQLKWYTVKIVYSTDNGVATTKVYVDGVLTNVEPRAATEITHLAVKFYTGSEMEIYVDNIRVTEGDHTPATVTCLGECSFDQQVVSDAYKATKATCTTAATYYYSCVCGEKGTTTFESGDLLAHSYTGTNGVCVNGCGKTKAENDIIAKYLAYFDFEDGIVRGQFSAANGSAEVIDVYGNKLLALKSDGSASTDWYYSLGGSYQNVTMTYNVAIVSKLVNSLVMFPTVTDKDQYRPNVEFGVNRNGNLKWNNGSAWANVTNASNATAIVTGRQTMWHTVKIVYSSAEGTSKVYIDGVLTNVEPNKTTDITKIAVRFYKNVGNESEMYIDNIRVSVDDHDAASPAPLESGEHGISNGQTGFVGDGLDFTLDFEDIPVNYYPGALSAGAYQTEDAPDYYLGVKEINGNKVLYMEGHGYGWSDAIAWTYKLNGSYKKATLSYYIAEVTKEPFLITYPTLSNQHYWNPVTKFGLSGSYGGEMMWYRDKVGWVDLMNTETEVPIRHDIMEWHQVKIVYDANDGDPVVAVYIDGVLTDAGDALVKTSDEVSYISVRMNGNYYYGGKLYMDNFRVTEEDHEPMEAPKPLISDTKASSMTVDSSSLNLTVGGHQYITPTVSPADTGDKTVTYTSSNPNVATVDEWGEVYGVSAGSAVITVTSNSNTAVKVQIPVTVTNRSTMKTIYVSANGGGNGTTANNRCTLQEAMAQVSALHSSMTGDIVVSLAAGYYQLKETLEFDVTHGGTNNHYVTYKAEGEVTFGGKQVITGWSEYKNGIYCAPAAGIETRHLYVNNVRAVRARSEGTLLNAEFYQDSEGNVVGYISDNVELAQFAHPEDLEFVYQYRWFNSRNAVDSVALNDTKDKVYITMSQPGFTWQRSSVREETSTLAYYENALELLDEPGEWYLDTHAGVVYYMPRQWEDMRSVEISVPVVEELVSIEGADYDNKVQNIEFDGITFADATWNYPTEMGVLAIDQNNHLEENNVYTDKLIDGSVILKKTNSINFSNCEFTRLGSIGLKMVDGVQNSMIVGNKFYDISGSALSIGEPDYFNEEVCNPSDPAVMMKNCDVINNYIHDVAVDYQSSAGLSVGYAANVDISHNEIFDVPYSGMHIGYGWRIRVDNILKNMRIENNFIHDTSWGDVNDGGPIYVNGDTAGTKENPNVIANNYIVRSYQAVASIYPDGGASGWYVTNNFCDELAHENSWYIVWHPFANKQERQWVENNYITYDKDSIHPQPSWGQFEIEAGIVVDPENLPAEVLAIIAGAGLESEYQHLRGSFAELVGVNFEQDLEIKNAGDTFQIVVTAYDGLGNVTNADISAYFSIEDNSIATVNGDGVVTAVATGITVLKMTVITEGIAKEYVYNVIVGDILDELVIGNSNTLDGGIAFYLSSDGFVPEVVGKTVLGRNVTVEDFEIAIADTSIAYADGHTIIPKSAGKTTLTITGRYGGVEKTATFSLEIKGTTDNQNNGPTLTGMPDIFNKAYENYWMFVSEYEPTGGVQYGDGTIKMEGQYNATFAGTTYLSELLTVGMYIDTATVGTGNWPTIMIRNQDYKKLVTNGTGYLFVFVEDTGIELHRYNNGKRTQIYGDVLGFKSLAGSGILGAYKDNTYYEVQVGAINEADGVRLILRLNGVEIINFLDTDPLAIRDEGYFGICGRYEIITLTYIPVDNTSDSDCVDANKDHICDDCGKSVGIHMPIIGGHHCDYCGEVMTVCADLDNDHECDDCEKVLSTCADTDDNHKCDICGYRLTFCDDGDGDHNCDLCGKKIRCRDKNKDHKCDYCDEILSECADRQGKDHLCDVCDKRLTECVNEDNDHVCDYCGTPLTPCVDEDGDLKCDMCGGDMEVTPDGPDDNGNDNDSSPNALIITLLVLAVLAVGGALVILIIRRKRRE